MLELLDPEPIDQTGTTTPEPLPDLSIISTADRHDGVPATPERKTENFRVKSISRMVELFTQDTPTIFLGGQMGTVDRHEIIDFCEQEGMYYYDPDESDPEDKSFETTRDTDKTGVLLSMYDVF